MRRSLVLSLLLFTAGCGGGGQADEQPAPGESASADRAAPGTGPDVAPTAAPGVAFNYRYAFRLGGDRIAEVQERHAASCEQLGPARCRIMGMQYRVVGRNDVEAMLAFKLEPAIARRFGRAGVDAVVRSDGMLVESEITGTDVGTTLRSAGRSIAELSADLQRIEAQLARGGMSAEERSRLEYEAQQLRQSIRAAEANRSDAQDSLATTPVVFRYGSRDTDGGPDLGLAIENAGDTIESSFAVLLVLVVTLLPWALLALLGWWIVRQVRSRFARKPTPPAPPEPS